MTPAYRNYFSNKLTIFMNLLEYYEIEKNKSSTKKYKEESILSFQESKTHGTLSVKLEHKPSKKSNENTVNDFKDKSVILNESHEPISLYGKKFPMDKSVAEKLFEVIRLTAKQADIDCKVSDLQIKDEKQIIIHPSKEKSIELHSIQQQIKQQKSEKMRVANMIKNIERRKKYFDKYVVLLGKYKILWDFESFDQLGKAVASVDGIQNQHNLGASAKNDLLWYYAMIKKIQNNNISDSYAQLLQKTWNENINNIFEQLQPIETLIEEYWHQRVLITSSLYRPLEGLAESLEKYLENNDF